MNMTASTIIVKRVWNEAGCVICVEHRIVFDDGTEQAVVIPLRQPHKSAAAANAAAVELGRLTDWGVQPWGAGERNT